MLTLFTTPKPFQGHIGVIQRNAIASWTHLTPRPEIILFGDEEGAKSTAEEFGIVYVPNILRNEFGTPRVDGLFDATEEFATQPILCYVNADIILTSGFIRAIEQVVRRKSWFLIVGQRWDFDITTPLEFGPDWEDSLLAQVRRAGKLHNETGIDYFVFARNLWGEVPPFAIGRTAWDNWLLYRARARMAAVVDATQVIMAIHQNHDYAHHPDGERGIWKGKEAERNRELGGGSPHFFTLFDATHMLTPQGLRRVITLPRIRQHLMTLPTFYPYSYVPSRVVVKSLDLVMSINTRLKKRSILKG